MNKLFSVLCVLGLLFTSFANVTFAQYGGGSRGGSSSSSLVKDNCPDGDTSGSYYDGTCGDGEEMMEETEEEMMDDDSDSDLLESIDNNTDEDDMMEEEAEEEMMDDDMDEGTSLFDLLKDRDEGGSTSDSTSTNGNAADGTNGFVLPGVLAATGAAPMCVLVD